MSTIAEHREAVSALLERWLPRRVEQLELSAAAVTARPSGYDHRVLADDVVAVEDVPPFDNSQMDGFAVRVADLAAPGTRYPLAAEVAAGTVPPPLPAGRVAPIMTGAPMPHGADAVIPVEHTGGRFAEHTRAGSVAFDTAAEAGLFVRPRGSDVTAGTVLATAGTVLDAAQYGALVSAGLTAVRVLARPRVALVTTGLELAEPGAPLAAGQIRDANQIMLAHALGRNGAEVTVHAYRSDEPAGFLELLARVAATTDLVVTTGAVSRGTREVVREALTGRGVTFDSVAMQPGGPQGRGLFTTGAGTIPIVCLPGNPVSVLVSFEMFLRPVLRRLTRRTPADRPTHSAPLAHELEPLPDRHQVRRGVFDAHGRASTVGGAGSHLLTAYARSTVLIHVPPGRSRLPPGTPVEIWRIDD